MKKHSNLIGIIALVSVIGFSFAACGGGNDDNRNENGNGNGGGNQTPIASDYTIGNLNQTAGSVTAVTITPKSGKSTGAVNIKYAGNTTIPQTAGTYAVTFDVAAATGWNTATNLSAGTLVVTVAVATNPTITIKNNTGYKLDYSYIKPSTSTNWGSDLGPSWADGESKSITLSQSLSAQSVYDIRLRQGSSSGYMFIKYGVTVSNGMTITFTTSDLNDDSFCFAKTSLLLVTAASMPPTSMSPLICCQIPHECFLMYLPIIKREMPISNIDILIIN